MSLLMFTFLFGGAIAGSTGEYLDYILPGVLVMSVLFTTVYSGVALNTDLTKGVVDRFRSLPIWRPAPLGSLLGDSVRWIFTTIGLLLRSPSAVLNAGFLGIFPLTFLSNVFVDPDTLPAGLEAFVDVNPISILATASRGLMEGNADVRDIAIVLAVAAALTTVFAPLTTRLYRRAERSQIAVAFGVDPVMTTSGIALGPARRRRG